MAYDIFSGLTDIWWGGVGWGRERRGWASFILPYPAALGNILQREKVWVFINLTIANVSVKASWCIVVPSHSHILPDMFQASQ